MSLKMSIAHRVFLFLHLPLLSVPFEPSSVVVQSSTVVLRVPWKHGCRCAILTYRPSDNNVCLCILQKAQLFFGTELELEGCKWCQLLK